MKAEFFRMIFHKVKDGVYYTASMKDELRQKTLHVAYIAQGAVLSEQENAKEDYPLDILVAGDVEETTCDRIRQMLENRKVHEIILPEGASDQLVKDCGSYGVKVTVVEDLYRIKTKRWELRFRVFEGTLGKTLVMYQGYCGDDLQKEDCAFAAKIIRKAPCVSCIYGEDDYCGFGCMHHKDYDVLQGHKREGEDAYRMGTLVLGNMILKGQSQKLQQMLEGVTDRVRCVCLPTGMNEDNYERKWLEKICDSEDYIYVLRERSEIESVVTGRILGVSPFVQYRSIDEETGFCASGYRIPYIREKDC